MATQETVKQITQGGVTRDVEDTTARQGLVSKVDKETGKGLSTNDYTTVEKTKLTNLPTADQLATQMNSKANDNAVVKTISVNGGTPVTPVNGNVNISVEGGEVPTKVSDLENDEGFVAAQDVAGIVAATGDLTIVESSDYIDIVISHPELTVTTLSTMSASTKSGTFKVSGTHLKDDVTISTSATNWTLSADGGTTTSQSLTLSPTVGTLAETTITVIYSGTADSTGNTITIASSGATSQTVTANYTEYAGPTILASPSSLSFSAAPNATQQKTLTVTGSQLSGNITTSLSGTNASLFSVAGTLTTSGGTLTITYSPTAAGSHSATLTLSSTGAENVTVALSATAEAAVEVDENGFFVKDGITYGIIYDDNVDTGNVAVYNKEKQSTSAAASANRYTGAISIPATVSVNGTTYNVTTIKGYAFASCSGMTSLTIAEGITTIGLNAIRDCTSNSFTSITIPNSVTSMGDNNLYGCYKLRNIVFGDGLTALGKYINAQNNNLLNVTLGENIASIGKYSQFRMDDSGVVTIKRTTPPSADNVVFKTSNDAYPCNATLRVPSSAVNTYKTAGGWGVDNSANWHMFNPDNIVAIDE